MFNIPKSVQKSCCNAENKTCHCEPQAWQSHKASTVCNKESNIIMFLLRSFAVSNSLCKPPVQKNEIIKILLEILNFDDKLAAVLTKILCPCGAVRTCFFRRFYYGSTRWY